MNDPVVKNFGRLVGRRMLMVPIMMAIMVLGMVVLGIVLILVSMVAGSNSGLFVFAAVVITFLFFAAVIGGLIFFAFRIRKKMNANYDSAFGWLSTSRQYMINGRQFAGTYLGRDVGIKIHNRPRGGGAVLNFEVPTPMPGQMVIGTRSSVGKFIQGLISTYEVTGTVFDQRNYALSTVAEHEGFARWMIEQPTVMEAVTEMMQTLSGYEVRAIRFDNKQASFVIAHPEAQVLEPVQSQRIMELLVRLVDVACPRAAENPVVEQVQVEEPSVIAAELVSDDDDVISRIQVVDEKDD